jgi:hypothetical protein
LGSGSLGYGRIPANARVVARSRAHGVGRVLTQQRLGEC